MNDDQKVITTKVWRQATEALHLVGASLEDIKPYDSNKCYTPKEQEPYDALSDRFMRAVEISLKFFRSYEKLMFGENSDTLRDLLNRMAKLEFISSTTLWLKMRDVRNRIVHDYLPEDIAVIYGSVMGEFGEELLGLKNKKIDF